MRDGARQQIGIRGACGAVDVCRTMRRNLSSMGISELACDRRIGPSGIKS
jgi:hypothetical protein